MFKNDTEIAHFIIDEIKRKTSDCKVEASPDGIHYHLDYNESRITLVIENNLVTILVHSLGIHISPSDHLLLNKINREMFLSKLIMNSSGEIKMLTSTIKTSSKRANRLFVKFWVDEMAAMFTVAEDSKVAEPGNCFFSIN